MPWREDFDTFIGENAFRRDFAPKKEEIEVSPDNKVFSCYEGALLNHLEGRLIYCPKNKVSFSIPETVQIIGKYAFESCNKLKKVEIPTSVRVIEEGAFANCRSLKHLVIPESVTDIGDCALEFYEDLAKYSHSKFCGESFARSFRFLLFS